MSLLERVGASHPSEPPAPDTGSGWWPPVLSGALAACSTWLLLALPALLIWVASAKSTVGWSEALGIASGLWFLGNGLPVTIDGASVSVVPLGLWAAGLALTSRALWRILAATQAAARGTTWPALLATRILPAFFAGYAGVGLLAWLLTLGNHVRTTPLDIGGVLGVPLLATIACLTRRYAVGQAPPRVTERLDRLPRWAHRALAPGLWGAALLTAAGTVVVLVAVLARFATVSGLHAALGTGAVGGLLLVLAQLLFLPNLALWALAWLAGPGFAVADGPSITLTGAQPGLLPMVPVLGALPPEGAFPGWVRLALVVPVAVGAVIAWRACRSLARLSSWRTKLATGAAAATLAAVVVGGLAALGSGSAGVDRLRHVGAQPVPLVAALLGELLLGVVIYVGVDHLRLRRRH